MSLPGEDSQRPPGLGPDGSEQRGTILLPLVLASLGGACAFLVLFIFMQHRRKRRLRRAAMDGGANAPDGRPPSHLTVLERAALAETATDLESIRQLRQRRWAARNSNNGLTLDELDLVAPVRAYEKVGHRTRPRVDESASDDEPGGAAVAGAEGAKSATNDVDCSVQSWDGASDDTCAVCLDDMAEGDKTRKLRCSHEFHADCIQAWVTKANRCPVCSVEPLEAAAIAKRRNARSSTRRGIDAAISQQRRRRTRGANGTYELDSEVQNGAAEPGDDADAVTNSVTDDGTPEGSPIALGIPVPSGAALPSPSSFAERPRDSSRAEVVLTLPEPAVASRPRQPPPLAPAAPLAVSLGRE